MSLLAWNRTNIIWDFTKGAVLIWTCSNLRLMRTLGLDQDVSRLVFFCVDRIGQLLQFFQELETSSSKKKKKKR